MALAKMNFSEDLMDHTKNHWRKDLDVTGLNVLEEWVRFFKERYPVVGYIEE